MPKPWEEFLVAKARSEDCMTSLCAMPSGKEQTNFQLIFSYKPRGKVYENSKGKGFFLACHNFPKLGSNYYLLYKNKMKQNFMCITISNIFFPICKEELKSIESAKSFPADMLL